MKFELIQIDTNTEPLDGLLYEPDGAPAKLGVILMHGNVGNFYSGPMRFMADALVQSGYACLAFNRRGHDILTNPAGRAPAGGAFQTAAEGMADNEYAARFMAGRGYVNPVILGHSNGGLLASAFVAHHGDVAALILLSAHAGGSDTYQRTCAAGLMAIGESEVFATRARAMVAEGRGNDLLVMPGWWYAVSASSLVDRIENTPRLLDSAPNIKCPVLAIRGRDEPEAVYPMEQFAQACGAAASTRIIENADHWYTTAETEVSTIVVSWLDALRQTQSMMPHHDQH